MNKININDVTFLVPVRMDSKDRRENLETVIDMLHKDFDTNFIVLEADKSEKVTFDKEYENVRKVFVEDDNPIFHRTKYINMMCGMAETEYLGVWDTDVVVSPTQIMRSVEALRNMEAQFVIPYDGRFVWINSSNRGEFLKNRSIRFLESEIDNSDILGTHSVGGGFLVERKSYLAAGGENENFKGWGAEDVERVKRMEILGCSVLYVDGPMYHLHHERGINSIYPSEESEKEMLRELLKVCAMNKVDLEGYVESWK